jgi:hypothetical protein
MAREREPRDVAGGISELRRLIESGQHLPGSRVIVDEQLFLRAADDIRSIYAAELQHARRIAHNRNDIISEARAEADHLVLAAKRKAEAMLTDVGIRAAAEESAEELFSQAGKMITSSTESSWRYAIDRLVRLDNSLRDTEQALSEARRKLAPPE